MSINKVILIGRLTHDPRLSYPGGSTNGVVDFSIATNESYTGKDGQKVEKVEYHKIIAWGGLAENVSKYCKKGSQVFIEGSIATRQFKAKDGTERRATEIKATTVKFLDSRGEAKAAGQELFDEGSLTLMPSPQVSEPVVTEDDIPF